MDWVHCNICFFQPGQLPKRDFNLTSCGHIFCKCCEKSGPIEKCKICGVKCTTTPLSAQMAKEIQIYFEDPEATQEKLMKVMEFQRSHRLRLNENYRRLVGKYHALKVGYQRLEERNRMLQEEVKILKRSQDQNVMTPPPQPQPEFPLFCKNSQASKAIRNSMSQPNTPSNSLFVSPVPTEFVASQQYRRHTATPTTPLSETSSASPLSLSSYRGSPLSSKSCQSPYRPGLTPPYSRLRTLSVNPLKLRNPERNECTRNNE